VNHGELKNALLVLVSTFFVGATVSWGKVKAVSSKVPQIVLSMGGINRHYQPITQSVNGVPINVYASKTTLQVDLYTKGRQRAQESGVTAAFENTAVKDMAGFLNFLDSEYADNWCGVNDVSILVNQVQDLTELINDTSWDYRAMVELEVGFTETAAGFSMQNFEGGVPLHSNGIPKYDEEGFLLDEDGNREPGVEPLPQDEDGNPIYPSIEPSPSGGGSQDLADQSTGWFEKVATPKNIKEESNDGKQT